MDNSLLTVRNINRKYIAADRRIITMETKMKKNLKPGWKN